MSETLNYGLYITSDDTEKFLSWREMVAGESNSNMVKIDSALAEMEQTKATHSNHVIAMLYASQWSGTSAPYTQEISVTGLTATQNGVISLGQNATAKQRAEARKALLSVVGQSEGMLRITADGEKPSANIPVLIILLD